MAKPTNYRGIHISVTYDMGYEYYEISQINKGKKWNDKTLFATLKEAKMYIDEHYDELIKNESKKTVRKSIREQFVGKGEGGYRKPDKTKFNSGICLDSNGVKHTVIFDTHVEDFIVWVDNDNYLMWYVSSPQSLLNNLAESDLDENLILDIVALWEKLPKKRIKK